MSETTTTEQPATAQSEQQGDPADKPLGENGEKALKAERDRAKELERQLNAAAKRLSEIEQANETALEKAQREAREAEQRAEALIAEALRYRVAAKHGISDEDAELFLTGTDEQTLERQAARLVERAPQPSGPKPDLTQAGGGQSTALNGDGLEEALKSKLGIA